VRTVYLGTSPFAATVLRRLCEAGHAPALAITRPDAPRGRGRRTAPPAVAEAARTLGLPLEQPQNVNDESVRARIAAARPDVVVICAYGALVRDPLLSEHPMLNVHPSLLPRWRGAAPIERAIEAGDAGTGVSIMRPTAELDAGPVCLAGAEAIEPDDDYGSLSARLAELSGVLLVRALEESPDFVPQPEEGVTVASKVEAVDRELTPDRRGIELERRVRALRPHIGTYLYTPDGERLGVRRVAVAHGAEGLPLTGPPGRLSAHDGRLLWSVADGALELLEVQPAGGRPMGGPSYLRGRGAAFARSAA